MYKFFQSSPLFVKLASISLFSKIGDRLFYTALLSSAALLNSRSDLAVMLVSLSETLPLLFGFILGSLADKRSNKTLHLVQSGWVRVVIYFLIGLLFTHSTTLALIFGVTLLNFCSDLLGNYSTALVTPFTKALVPAEQMQQAQGFLSVGTQLFTILATFLGSFLLVFVAPNQLALINAGIFWLVTLAFKRLAPQLKHTQHNLPIQDNISIRHAIRQNFHMLSHQRSLFFVLIQLSFLNGFFGGLTPIFTLFVKDVQQVPWLPLPLKIASLSGMITLGMILGSLSCQKLLPHVSLKQLSLLTDFLILVTALAFYLQNIYVILLSSALAAFLLGIISPRFSAQIVNAFSTTHLGGIVTIINSCLVIIPPLTSLLFPLFANFDLAYLGLVTYSSLLILSGLLSRKLK